MSFRCALRHAATPCRGLSTTAKHPRPCVVHSNSNSGRRTRASSSDASVSTHSALQRQQLEFCCLLCGWDMPCGTCPFDWFGFDPRKFQGKQHRRRGDRGGGDMRSFMVSQADIREAMATLGVNSSSAESDPITISEQRVKAAFRAKALEWHPDCNPDPEAEDTFKRILLAYELLLAHAR